MLRAAAPGSVAEAQSSSSTLLCSSTKRDPFRPRSPPLVVLPLVVLGLRFGLILRPAFAPPPPRPLPALACSSGSSSSSCHAGLEPMDPSAAEQHAAWLYMRMRMRMRTHTHAHNTCTHAHMHTCTHEHEHARRSAAAFAHVHRHMRHVRGRHTCIVLPIFREIGLEIAAVGGRMRARAAPHARR
jgi:hypothetical protein